MIVAVMIVKDESHVLERCLRSVMPHVDGCYILDTGSTEAEINELDGIISTVEDATDKKIIASMAGWHGFAQSRNDAMTNAIRAFDLKPEDWLFMIDADDVVEAWEAPTDSWRTGYHVTMRGENCVYPRVQVFQVLGAWRYVGVVHEFPEAGSVGHVGTLATVVRSTREGARNRDPEKYLNDAKLIETELAKGVDDELLKRRYCFYLAQSYRDAGQINDALNYYEGRAMMGGYVEEVYVSLLEGMRLRVARDGFVNSDIIEDMLIRAQTTCPQRRECVWQIMRWLRELERWNDVIMLYKRYPPVPAPQGGLFIELRAYDYGMHDEAGVAYYWLGDFAESIYASVMALASYPDTHGDIKRIIANLGHAQRNL